MSSRPLITPSKGVDKEGSLNFRPYSYTAWGILKASLFGKQGGEVSLVPREAILVKAQTAGNRATYFSPHQIGGWESIVVHNRWRVLRQLGYD